MPYWSITEGDTVFVRALVIEAASNGCRVVIEDPQWKTTIWVPPSELARRQDIDELRPIRRTARFLDR